MSPKDYLGTLTRGHKAPLPRRNAGGRRLKSQAPVSSPRAQRQTQALESAQAILAGWREGPKAAGEKMLERHGEPQETTATQMFWFGARPWSRIELTAHAVVHNFPSPHTDFLTQYVDYPIPAARAGDLLAFHGSVLLDRTAGRIGARCGDEAYNILTLNLAVEIIGGRIAVGDARRLYIETAIAYLRGGEAPYAERLQFTPVGGADPDEWITVPTPSRRGVEEGKQVMAQKTTPTETSIE